MPAKSRATQSLETKRRMIEAAIAVFSEHGYERATTRELAERAGCSEGLIYKHFGGKRELLFAALEFEREKGGPELGPVPPSPDLETELIKMLRRNIEIAWARQNFFRVCMSLAAIDPEMGRIMETIEQQTTRRASDRLLALRDAGVIDPDADIEAAGRAMHMFALALGFSWQIVYGRSRKTVDEALVGLMKQFARSLVRRS